MATHSEPNAALQALRDENVTIRRDKNDLQRENEDLRKILEDFESRFTCCRSSRKKALQIENERFRSQNEALTKDVESMRSDWEAFWRERENMVEKSKALSEALSKIEILNKQNTDLENKKHTLQQTIKKMNLNSKREKEIMAQQCDMLQKQVLQQDANLQDREVARLKTQALTEENQSLRKKTIQLQLENHHMTRRLQYENDLKRLQKLCVERDVEETQQNLPEQFDDRVDTPPEDEEEENIPLQEQAQVRTLVQRYEQILDELGRENQSIHKRNGDLELEVAEFKRTVCMEARRHDFEGDQQEVMELDGRSRDGEDALVQKDVACQVELEQHQVVQQELQESLRQDYSRIQQENQALEQELQEAKDMMLHLQSVRDNETLPEQNAHLQLRDLERVHNEAIEEKKTLHEQNEALEQRVQELIKELRDGEEAKRREALACPQGVQEFKSVQTDVEVFQSPNDALMSDSKSLRQELQEAKDMILHLQSVRDNETLPEQNAQLQLRDLERVHNEAIEEKKTLHEQNEALEQRVQELIKELRDGEEAKRREALACPQGVQELKIVQTGVEVFQGPSDALMSETESLRQRNKDLDQEVQEAKNMVLIEKRLFAREQINAFQREEASCDELQTLRILLTLKMKEIDELRSELMLLKIPTTKE
ncbi:trichohyalin-like [Clinocottus analis]|uniref:trichohyalin-like n=1 Tax=Clinocottus analis TaxID=304258 RepID=UPI0035BF29D6